MNWNMDVGGWFRGLFRSQAPSSVAAPPKEDYPSASPVKSWSDDEWLDKVKKSAAVSIPLGRLTEDIASVRWHLWQLGEPGPDGKPTRTEVLSHPLLDLWDRPCPLMLGRIFRGLWVHYWEVLGKVLIRIVYSADGRTPERLWILPPNHLKQRCDLSSDDPRKRMWKILWQGKPIDLPPAEILYMQRPDPSDPYGTAVGTVMAVKDELEQVSWMNRWSSNFFRLGAHIGKIIGIVGLGDQNRRAIQADFTTSHTGVDNVGKTLFVDLGKGGGAISVVNAGPTQKDMDWINGLKFLYQKIRQVWGIPPEIIGDIENSNKATAEAAGYIHQANNVRPRLSLIADYVNAYITPLFEPPGSRTLRLEPAEVVMQTRDQRHQEANDGWRSGAITRNNWLAAHDEDPIPGPMGDQYLVPLNTAAVDPDGTVHLYTGEGLATPPSQPDSIDGGAPS